MKRPALWWLDLLVLGVWAALVYFGWYVRLGR